MNLLWQMDPYTIKNSFLEYQYTILGRLTYFGRWTPLLLGIVALNTGTQYLADKSTLADGPPHQLRIDALNTSAQYLADESTLADGPPSTPPQHPKTPPPDNYKF